MQIVWMKMKKHRSASDKLEPSCWLNFQAFILKLFFSFKLTVRLSLDPPNPTNSLWCLKCGVPLYVNTVVIAFCPEGDMTVGGKLNGNPFHSCWVHISQNCKALSGARGKVGELTKVMTKPCLGTKTTKKLSMDKMLVPVKIVVHLFGEIYCL